MIDLRYGRCCLESLRAMPAQSVHCCVTSPPYYGLRNYGLKPSIWGGDPACKHEWSEHVQPAANGIIHDGGMSGETLSGGSATRKPKKSSFCRCGAWLGCLGLEPTLEMFVGHLVLVFEEVRRVLRDDGTLWLNLGDSYASGKGTCFNPGGGASSFTHRAKEADRYPTNRRNKSDLADEGIKSKDLYGVPWAVAFALRDAGWYLRSDIVWNKPNPMPESVSDRPTHSHEYLFLFSKSERYFYDNLAIAEPSVTNDLRRPYGSEGSWLMDGRPEEMRPNGKPRKPGPRAPRPGIDAKGGNQADGEIPNKATRNKRSVWTVPTMPFPGAHFAVFPPALIEPCIMAGTSAMGCCASCGAQWGRITEKEEDAGLHAEAYGKTNDIGDDHHRHKRLHRRLRAARAAGGNHDDPFAKATTIGWGPACECEAPEPIRSTVLDPFSGSGTTVATAFHLGRNGIGLDASTEYEAIARERCGELFLAERTS